MFGIFRDPVREGVTRGLEKSFARGGPFERVLGDAMDKALAPLKAELTRLRKLEHRYRWHPLKDAQPWVFDGRAMLVNQCGDMVWASYIKEDGEDGYWDADIEYGGRVLDPAPTHFFPVPRPPASSEGGAARQPQADEGRSAAEVRVNQASPPSPKEKHHEHR